MPTKNPPPKKYSAELKQRAVRMVRESTAERGDRFGVVTDVARKLDVGVESLRKWVAQMEIDEGTKPGVTTDDRRRILELEQENRELRRANEILKTASAFFARELDPRLPR